MSLIVECCECGSSVPEEFALIIETDFNDIFLCKECVEAGAEEIEDYANRKEDS